VVATLFEMASLRTSDEHAWLPIAEFAFPGPLRDQLVRAILNETKISTTGLVAACEIEREPLPRPGQRSVVVDSYDRPVAVIETTGVSVVALGEVDLAHVVDEGEGYTVVDAWRRGHEEFWRSEQMLTVLGDAFVVDDTTLVVLERFKLVERLSSASETD
jgi:uncharacterized protein YhfF